MDTGSRPRILQRCVKGRSDREFPARLFFAHFCAVLWAFTGCRRNIGPSLQARRKFSCKNRTVRTYQLESMRTFNKLFVAGWLLAGSIHGSANLLETAAVACPLATALSFNGTGLGEGTIGLAHTNAAFDPYMQRPSIAFGNGTFVAVDGHNYVLTSLDATAWRRRDAGTAFALYDLAFGHGLFVAVGNEGAILISPDGVNWTMQKSDTDDRLRGVAWGNGRFVAVGYSGSVVTSKDAVRWTKQYCDRGEPRASDFAKWLPMDAMGLGSER